MNEQEIYEKGFRDGAKRTQEEIMNRLKGNMEGTFLSTLRDTLTDSYEVRFKALCVSLAEFIRNMK